MKKIFLWGYYGSANIGDNILLDVIVKQIKEVIPEAKITLNCRDKTMMQDLPIKVISYNPSSDSKVLYFLSLLKFYSKIAQTNDIIIFGGGTQIYDNSKYTWKSLFVTASILLINKIFYHTQVIHYGIGIGTIHTKLGKFFTKLIIKCSDYLIVRDVQSYQKLLEFNVSKKKVFLSRDLAYSISDSTFYSNKETLKKNDKIKIGFSLFEYYKYTEVNKDKDTNLTKNLLDIVKNLSESNKYQIYLFSFQKKYGNNDEDFLINMKNMLQSENIIFVPYQNDWQHTIENLKTMDICIGMRYHFLVLSLMMRKPTIALNYANKVRNEFIMYGLNEYIIELDNVSIATVTPLLDKLILDKNVYNLIDSQLDEIKKEIGHSNKLFKELIE